MTKKEYINKRFDAGRTICRAGKRYIIKYAPTNAGVSREVIDFMDFPQIVKKEIITRQTAVSQLLRNFSQIQ